MSKLYTEKQVKQMIDIAEFNTHLNYDDILNEFTPIQLPTDEEIEKESYQMDYGGGSEGWFFRQGAKWMRDKIKGGQGE